MKPNNKILIIEPSRKIQNEFSKLLSDNTFVVEYVNSADEGIRRSIQKRFDLILCQKDLEYTSGFQVFKKLGNSLLKSNTAFFLIMEKFESEDVLIGLEMGVDNFIITPFQKQAVLNKINNQFKKQKEFDFVETQRFKEVFNITPLPLIVVENHCIVEINNACKNLLNLNDYNKDKLMFMDVFNIGDDDNNKLKIRKLGNGLIESCILENVKLHGDSENSYTIHKYNVSKGQGGKVFAEIVRENNVNGNKDVDEFCPQHGRCLKVTQKGKAFILPNFKLTKRENEVFKFSAQGLPIKQISVQLGISERTVEKYRSNIMQKTKTHNIIEALLVVQNQYAKPE